MDQLTLSLSLLLVHEERYFRAEVYHMFCSMVGAWIVCLGRRTISRVWETTGRSRTRDHSAAFRLFSEAGWNWDELCRLLIIDIVTNLILGSEVWVVVDDTLCHKRGSRVAFGGVFLDAVLSSKKHKIFRFGNNWVTLGIVVKLPFRQDRYYCLNVLWRVCQKRGNKPRSEHRTRSQLAAEMVKLLAKWLPSSKIRVVADSAYVGKFLLKDRPANVDIIGPIPWDAELTEPLLKPAHRRRKRGARLPSPQEILDGDDPRWQFEEVRMVCPNGTEKVLKVKVLRDICWYPSAGSDRLMIVLLRDSSGKWRNEALLSTESSMTVLEVIAGYCRRWSVEVAYADSKGLLGLHDPAVWCENSVQRAHPMSWYVGSLVVLWYALFREEVIIPQRHRPWYRHKPEVTFADMLAACRYDLWQNWLAQAHSPTDKQQRIQWLLEYLATAA